MDVEDTSHEEFADVDYLLSTLTERDRAIMVMRFGLSGHKPMTLLAIGSQLGYTRERIRQIVDDCLSQFRGMIA